MDKNHIGICLGLLGIAMLFSSCLMMVGLVVTIKLFLLIIGIFMVVFGIGLIFDSRDGVK